MTFDELVEYYVKLLIIQYKGKPKAVATIRSLVTLALVNQIFNKIQDAYDPETAVGVQLEILCKYAGVTRTTNTPGGTITLVDEDLRKLMNVKIAANNTDGSLLSIQTLIDNFFPGLIEIYDYRNKHISYVYDLSEGSADLARVLFYQKILPKPMGVAQSSIITLPNADNFFGFRRAAIPPVNAKGFNRVDDHDVDRHWLNHTDTVT